MVYRGYLKIGMNMGVQPRQSPPLCEGRSGSQRWVCLKFQEGQKNKFRVETRARATDDGGSSDPLLVCASCDHPITSKQEKISRGGAHEHTFANPAGVIFCIGCFRSAPGCMRTGERTAEFSWFAGYQWSYAACSLCGTHLGWFYNKEESTFYGLILDRLIEKGQKAK